MGWIGLSFWLLLKQMTAKPIESSWLNGIIALIYGGLLLYWGLPWEDTLDKAQVFGGAYGLLIGILFIGEQIGNLMVVREERKAQEQARRLEEEEETPVPSGRRRAPRTPSARVAVVPVVEPSHTVAPTVEPVAEPTPSSCGPVGAAYGTSEESPILVEPVEEPATSVLATPVSPVTEEEKREDEENSSPTLPPAAKPLSGKRVCVTGKLPYKRKAITDFIVAMGGEVKNRPTRNTDYLVAGEDCGTKLDEAEKYGVAVIDYADLLALCGLPVDADIYEAMPREFREERMRGRLSSEEAREYGREFKRRLHLLQEILNSTVSDLLPKSVQVVTQVDDELELHRVSGFRSTPRGELVLLSTEGEAIYLNDLTGDSVVRLLGLYRR